MSLNQAHQTYKQNAVQTASPGELTLMLYNGCLNYIRLAKQGMAENNIEAKNTNIQKAQEIIRELMVTLDTQYEVAHSMLRMYDYMLQRLIEANVKNDPTLLDEVADYVVQFRDTWKEVLKRHRQKQYGGGVYQDGKL